MDAGRAGALARPPAGAPGAGAEFTGAGACATRISALQSQSEPDEVASSGLGCKMRRSVLMQAIVSVFFAASSFAQDIRYPPPDLPDNGGRLGAYLDEEVYHRDDDVFVKVVDVLFGSPLAGIVEDGDFIFSINGYRLRDSSDLISVVRSLPPGTPVSIEFLDANKDNQVTSAEIELAFIEDIGQDYDPSNAADISVVEEDGSAIILRNGVEYPLASGLVSELLRSLYDVPGELARGATGMLCIYSAGYYRGKQKIGARLAMEGVLSTSLPEALRLSDTSSDLIPTVQEGYSARFIVHPDQFIGATVLVPNDIVARVEALSQSKKFKLWNDYTIVFLIEPRYDPCVSGGNYVVDFIPVGRTLDINAQMQNLKVAFKLMKFAYSFRAK